MRCRAALLPVAKILLAARVRSGAFERGQRIPRSWRECGRTHRRARLDRALEQGPGFGAVAEGRLQLSEVVRDRTPVRTAATEAVEHHVPVGVGLEQLCERPGAITVAECGGSVGE